MKRYIFKSAVTKKKVSRETLRHKDICIKMSKIISLTDILINSYKEDVIFIGFPERW